MIITYVAEESHIAFRIYKGQILAPSLKHISRPRCTVMRLP